jgi:TonB-linked SusC/RagA family outer membrane protein
MQKKISYLLSVIYLIIRIQKTLATFDYEKCYKKSQKLKEMLIYVKKSIKFTSDFTNNLKNPMKKSLMTLVLIIAGASVLWAQKTVSGVLRSADDGQTLPGVSIVEKGTANGTTTDLDGKYTLTVKDANSVLVFSFMGMTPQEVTVGTQTSVSPKLKEDATKLAEVEVTALGLKRSKDKSANSSTKVGGQQLAQSGESGVIQAMSGKSSGVNVVRNTGDPGAGAYIQLRGQSTITQSVQPLIVVDGVAISNSSIGGGVDGVAQQSRLNDINPEDIASVEILKGAAAAAVWGTRAANGVIMITTKKGKIGDDSGKNISVDFHANVGLDWVNREFTKQDKFGQGSRGNFVANSGYSWGPKLDTLTGSNTYYTDPNVSGYGGYFVDQDGNKYYKINEKLDGTVYNDKNREQIFRTGLTTDIGAGISVVNDNTNMYISLADWNQKGVIRGNSDYRRSNVRFNFSNKVNEYINFRLNTYYARIKSNRIQQGSNLNGLYLGYLRTSPDFDNTGYKGVYYDVNDIAHFNAHRGYRKYLGNGVPAYNNPGWTINEQVNTSDVDRFTISPELNVNLTKKSALTFRYGLDYTDDRRITLFPYNSAGENAGGSFAEDNLVEKYHSIDLFLRTLMPINENLDFAYIIGGQYNIKDYKALGGTLNNFTYTTEPIYIFDNSGSDSKNPTNSIENVKNAGGYLVLNFDAYKQLFFELTGRVERASTFNKTIFYPSVSLAWDFSKYLASQSWFSFGKLRTSYGTVGIQPPAYMLATSYIATDLISGWGENLDGGLYGNPLVLNSVEGNPNITPELKTEFEIGADLRFFKDRISLAATFYTNKTVDVILPVKVAPSTGYSSQWKNAGIISNTGIELDLTTAIVKKENFTVNLLANFTKNKNMVEDLYGAETVFLQGFTGTSSRAIEGHALGTLWGGKWERDANGNMVLDANGFPVVSAEEGILGDPNPDWQAGLGMSMEYKGIKFTFLFQHSQGGDMWAGTEGILRNFGISEETAKLSTAGSDLKTYDDNTIAAGETFRGNIYDFGAGNVALDQSWYTTTGGGFGPVGEQFIYDATWTRLREVSISYSLPQNMVKKAKLQNVEIGVSGRNLLLWTDFPGIDPETNLTGATNGRGLEYFNNPSTRSVMFSLRIVY